VVKAPLPPVIICIASCPFTRRTWPMPMIVMLSAEVN
jgi:hypothetical protein